MFKLRRLNIPNGKLPFYLLEEDGNIPYQLFREAIVKDGNYESQINKIDAWMARRACKEPVPLTKVKPLGKRDRNDKILDFEYKTDMIRVYSFAYAGGEVIWDGERKDPKAQDRTILRLRTIKVRFYEQIAADKEVQIQDL